VTGSRDAYRERIAPLALDTAFAPWHRLGIFEHVRRSAAVIVPNSRDAFSRCKSANRPVLALTQGVPVVATRIPSLEPLDGAVVFDDFHGGLVSLLGDPAAAAERVRAGRDVIRREYDPAVVAARWRSVLGSPAPG
jgi:hypothetical protein